MLPGKIVTFHQRISEAENQPTDVSDKNVKITEEMKLNLPQNTDSTKYCLGSCASEFGIVSYVAEAT